MNMKKVKEGISWRIRRVEAKLCGFISKWRRASNIGKRLRRFARLIDPSGEPRKLFHTPELHDFLELLQRAKFVPSHIVDIGANHGNWTREVRKYFPDAEYTLFEPQPNLRPAMADLLVDGSRVSLNTLGVGNQQGKMLFTLHERDDSCTFTWSPEMAAEKGYRQIRVPVTTLDKHIEAIHLSWPEMIKIDAEGWDLEVLEGAAKALEHASVIMVEATVGNPSIPNTVPKICAALEQAGYRLMDFTDLNRPWDNRVLWLVEMAFVKKGSPLDTYSSKVA